MGKTYIPSREDIIKEINKTISSGKKGKKKYKNQLPPDLLYEANLSNMKICLLSLACMINNQDPHVYFANNKGLIHQVEKVGPDSDFFVEHSPVFHFDSREFYEIHSPDFRARFLILYITKIVPKLGKIINTQYLASNSGVLMEYAQKEIILNEVMIILGNFIAAYADGDITDASFMNLLIMTSFARSWVKYDERLEAFKLLKKETDKLVDSLSVMGNQIPADIIMNNIIKLAYLAATEDPDISGTPYIDGQMGFESEIVKTYVIWLGKSIAKSTKKKPIVFDSFLRSAPELVVKWEDGDIDKHLKLGCQALFYYDFITENKKIHSIIKQMLQ